MTSFALTYETLTTVILPSMHLFKILAKPEKYKMILGNFSSGNACKENSGEDLELPAELG